MPNSDYENQRPATLSDTQRSKQIYNDLKQKRYNQAIKTLYPRSNNALCYIQPQLQGGSTAMTKTLQKETAPRPKRVKQNSFMIGRQCNPSVASFGNQTFSDQMTMMPALSMRNVKKYESRFKTPVKSIPKLDFSKINKLRVNRLGTG